MQDRAMDRRSMASANRINGSKVPVVKLERCDKIWETLQVIKLMQEEHRSDVENLVKREPIGDENTISKKPPMTFIPDRSLPLNLIGEPDIPKPYIKYQPVLNNGNGSMLQFQLAEKRRVNLYHCEVCSKEFCNYKNFSDHQDQLHGITLPKKIASKRERLPPNKPADIKNFQNSVASDPLRSSKDKLISDENINLRNAVKTVTKSIKCKLCHRFYRDIEKHMAEYHNFGSLDGSSKFSDRFSNSRKVNSAMELEFSNNSPQVVDEKNKKKISQDVDLNIKKNSTNPSLKRKSNTTTTTTTTTMPRIEFRNNKLRRVRKMRKILNEEFPNGQMKCEICHREFVYYNSLCKHRRKHKIISKDDEQYTRVKKDKLQSVNSVGRDEEGSKISAPSLLAPDDNLKDDNIGRRTGLNKSSITKECNSLTDSLKDRKITAKKNVKIKSKNKCLCGRSFRSSYILFTHKSNCKFIKNVDDDDNDDNDNDNDDDKSSEPQIGVERDSGISIKIKKKNDSYEIVGKEGEKSPSCGVEISDSSSNDSDSSEFENRAENLIPEETKYSKEHEVLKIKLTEEDVHVEIEDDISRKNNNNNNHNNNNNKESKGQVPLLRELCKKFLIRQGLLPKEETTDKCRFCKIFIGSKEKLSKHIERHKKLMKRSCSCGIKFTSIEKFDDHVAATHPRCIICPYCKERYKSIVEWDEHICLVDKGEAYVENCNENHPCPNCNVIFNNVMWLDSHMKSEHLDPDLPFQCYQCVAKFPNEIARSIHFHKLHNQTSPCSICNQKLQSIKTKQKHEAYHRGVGFPCHKCKKTYPSKRSQLYHIRTVHNEYSNDKIQCFICKKIMKTRSFRKHVLRHNSKLECKICKKVLYDFRSLERHIMDHHRDEEYPREKCKICGVSFPTEEQLKAHIALEHTVRN